MYSTNCIDFAAVAYCLRVHHTWLEEHNNYKQEDSLRLLHLIHHCSLKFAMFNELASQYLMGVAIF